MNTDLSWPICLEIPLFWLSYYNESAILVIHTNNVYMYILIYAYIYICIFAYMEIWIYGYMDIYFDTMKWKILFLLMKR